MDIVQDIRQSLELDKQTPSVLSECVERSLELLTDQLYNTDTHFLLEFVQNAEDNEYSPGLVPTLRIGITNTSITLSCNEVGFSENNVRAICKIGASTKKNISGFIGEKGIGFKSVFKISDVVHVASGPFQFKFDRKERLGMIAPIWDPSRNPESGWTTFHLELSERRRNTASMLQELQTAIKPSLLLFLKKLRLIELDTKAYGNRSVRSITIERTDLDPGFIQLARTENSILRSKDLYFISKRTVKISGVPRDMRRGAESTEIVLAFPVNEHRKPLPVPQEVHAFLPVRKFGFKFVIHADFLTSSSREDIINDSPWNVNIRDAIADTFVAATRSFQSESGLCDVWIRYLPSGIVDPFFSPVESGLFQTLRTMQIVRDSNGVLRRPNEVIHVPHSYQYKGGALIEENFTTFGYLSDDYDRVVDKPVLERLGVREMTSEDFLSAVARIPQVYLSRRDNEWHEALCYELSRAYRQNKLRFNRLLSRAKILRLDDGTWSEVQNASRFVFESNICGMPDHVDFRRIHRCVHQSLSPRQYELYKLLGVRQADLTFVAEKILDFKGKLSVQQHISNACFFFSNRSCKPRLPSPAGRLLVVDESGASGTGEALYLDLPGDGGLLRRLLPTSARFLHSAYTNQFVEQQSTDWLCWLRDALGLNTAPRLVNMRLSLEFKEMVTTSNLSDVLEALKRLWPRLPARPDAPWLKELGQLSVKMEDDSRSTLDSMYLRRGVISRYDGIAFVPVACPESKDWDFLRSIGVTTKVGVDFYVKLLIQYESQKMDGEEIMTNIYKQLDARFDEDATRIINAFRNHPLIYVPGEVEGQKWKHLSEVYWKGPKAMRTMIALRKCYPALEEFFHKKLGLTDAPPEVLVSELKALAEKWVDKSITRDVHDSVIDIIVGISSLLERGRMNVASARDLLQHPIFPTYHSETGTRLRKLNDIYIPDYSGYYANLFWGKVPLLDFSGEESQIPKIRYLLQLAPADVLRLLDKCVDHRMEPRGLRTLHDDLTAKYCMKHQLFERLARSNSKHSDEISAYLTKLKEISIFFVDGISSELSIPGVSSISTDMDLVHMHEEEASITFFVNKSALSSYDEGDGIQHVHINICRRLADILSCNHDLVLICAMTTNGVFSDMLKAKGIASNDLRRTAVDDWMQTSDPRVSPPTSIDNHTTAPLRNTGRYGGSQWIPAAKSSSQNLFSTQSLEDEIYKVMQTIPEFSVPSGLVVRSRSQTRGTLARFFTQARLDAYTSLFQTPRPNTPIMLHGTTDASEAHSNDNQSFAHHSALTTVQAFPGPSNFVSGQSGGNFSPPSLFQEVNGFLGERYVYELLSATIGPTFSSQNWTSELRRLHPSFDPFEGESLADFTYKDCEGILTDRLFKDSPDTIERWIGIRPTYHIEVKSTSGGSREPFSMSKRQLQIALAMDDHDEEAGREKHIYVLIRVWNVRSPKSISHAIYVDPLRCISNETLKVISEKLELMIGE